MDLSESSISVDPRYGERASFWTYSYSGSNINWAFSLLEHFLSEGQKGLGNGISEVKKQECSSLTRYAGVIFFE